MNRRTLPGPMTSQMATKSPKIAHGITFYVDMTKNGNVCCFRRCHTVTIKPSVKHVAKPNYFRRTAWNDLKRIDADHIVLITIIHPHRHNKNNNKIHI